MRGIRPTGNGLDIEKKAEKSKRYILGSHKYDTEKHRMYGRD